MRVPSDEIQRATLTIVAESDTPVGSLRLAQGLADLGAEVAEATAGRYLNALEREGYIASDGPKRGRSITAKGRERLDDLDRRARLLERGRTIAKVSEVADIDDLIAVLEVRRALESEAASLAAQFSDDAQRHALAEAASDHVRVAQSGSLPSAEASSAFHLAIARASGNPVLSSVAQTLLDPANQRRLRSGEDVSVVQNVVAVQAREHLAIAEAISEGRAADAADLMRAHLDVYIEAARRFRDGEAPSASRRIAD